MKAAILVEQRKPLVVDDVSVPQLQYGQVLVRIHASGICGAQLNEIDGAKGEDRFLPHLLGHEGGGVVEAVGPGVSIVRPGQHVVLHWRKGVGLQAPPPRYRWGKSFANAGWVTTFNESAVVSENRVTPIPEEVEPEIAALYGCAVTSGFGVINNDARVKIGESVAVFGVGGVGMCVVLGARLAGAHPIIALDTCSWKLELACSFGATQLVASGASGALDELRRAAGEEGVNVAVDTTGIAEVMELAYEATRPDGRTILVGVPWHHEKIRIDSMPLHFEKLITGSHGGDANPSRDIPRYLRLQKEHRFDLGKLISHRYELDDINEAIAAIREGKVLRAVIRMGESSGP